MANGDNRDHDRRLPECREHNRFVHDILKEMGRDMKEALACAERTGVSTKGIWHELSNEVKPRIEDLRRSQPKAIQAHADGCPAYQNFMAKAKRGRSVQSVPAAPQGAPQAFDQGREIGVAESLPLPRSLLFMFVGLGVTIGVVVLILWKFGVF
jgi:hypothetical protein